MRYQQIRCTRRAWFFERVGWLLMAATIAAAGIGLFGNGWLSSSEATNGEDATVHYPRFARAHAPFVMTVDWYTQTQGDVVLSIDRAYLDDFAVTEVRPAPIAEAVDAQRIYYSFEAHTPAGRVSATFELRARRSGAFNGRVRAGNRADIAIRQFMFP